MKTFKQFLDEAKMNSGTFASAIERLSSSAKLGFELEMWITEDSDFLIVADHDANVGDFKKTAELAKESLEDLLGVDVQVGTATVNSWRIVRDDSIEEGVGNDRLGVGIEIVSPPTPVEDGIGDLKQVLRWMTKNKVVTNSSTGIHLNLSIPEIKEKLDPLKLVLFMGEQHILKSYDREFNTYAKQHRDTLLAAIQQTGRLPNDAKGLMAIAGSALAKGEKSRTVNFRKLREGYLEFRTGGNTDYHKKFPQIESDIGRFLAVLEIACDPDAERKEYLKKLAKLFNAGLETAK